MKYCFRLRRQAGSGPPSPQSVQREPNSMPSSPGSASPPPQMMQRQIIASPRSDALLRFRQQHSPQFSQRRPAQLESVSSHLASPRRSPQHSPQLVQRQPSPSESPASQMSSSWSMSTVTSPSTSPHGCIPSRPQCLEEAELALQGAERARLGQQVLKLSPETCRAAHGCEAARSTRSCSWLLVIVAIMLNVVIVSWQTSFGSNDALMALKKPHSFVSHPSYGAFSKDTDGDGIPDHRDFCVNPQCKGVHCPPLGWLSGRATDFDGDGCADGTEDMDKDNDGILDPSDKCPLTPQKYMFVSNAASDFDGDGCADTIEDSDDDNDFIPNHLDLCPLTRSGVLSDSIGCSMLQRENAETTTATASAQAERSEPKKSGWGVWDLTLRGAAADFLVSAILNLLHANARSASHALKQRTPSHPTESIGWGGRTFQGLLAVPEDDAWWWNIVRVFVYLSIIYWSRQNGTWTAVEPFPWGAPASTSVSAWFTSVTFCKACSIQSQFTVGASL